MHRRATTVHVTNHLMWLFMHRISHSHRHCRVKQHGAAPMLFSSYNAGRRGTPLLMHVPVPDPEPKTPPAPVPSPPSPDPGPQPPLPTPERPPLTEPEPPPPPIGDPVGTPPVPQACIEDGVIAGAARRHSPAIGSPAIGDMDRSLFASSHACSAIRRIPSLRWFHPACPITTRSFYL